MNNDLDQYKRQNAIVSIVVMVAVTGIYIVSANKAPYSDNVGAMIVPISIILLYGPLTSFAWAAFRTRQYMSANDTSEKFIPLVLQGMPLVFRAIGTLDLIIISAGIIMLVFELLIFPFWALKFLF